MSFRVLDLFCKAGGSARGIRSAFPDAEIIGIDIEQQPRYPFCFVQMDALHFEPTRGYFDFVWASPPCQFGTGMQHLGKARNGSYPVHPNLIDPIRKKILSWDLPYVIENVYQARKFLKNPIMLCGTQFDLKVYRHRVFESNVLLLAPQHKPHHDQTPSAGNGLSPKGFISVCGTGGVRGMNAKQIVSCWSDAMNIHWMNRAELAEAIPPAYSEYIARQIRP